MSIPKTYDEFMHHFALQKGDWFDPLGVAEYMVGRWVNYTEAGLFLARFPVKRLGVAGFEKCTAENAFVVAYGREAELDALSLNRIFINLQLITAEELAQLEQLIVECALLRTRHS